MIDEKNTFKILLPLKETEEIYSSIGNALITDIDLRAYPLSIPAKNNTICILENINLISKVEGKYQKNQMPRDAKFKDILQKKILDDFWHIIYRILEDKIEYDDRNDCFFAKRNSIPLQYSGLFMLLCDLSVVSSYGEKFIISKTILDRIKEEKKKKIFSIEELQRRLEKQQQIGEEAEQTVLKYETNKLEKKGIFLKPIQISSIDVSAGFDILSYNSNNSADKKYIEVKSCNKKKKFYISINELEVAKNKGQSYYLYLVNREDNSIYEINNPYVFFFKMKQEEWIIEVDSYKMHMI